MLQRWYVPAHPESIRDHGQQVACVGSGSSGGTAVSPGEVDERQTVRTVSSLRGRSKASKGWTK